MSRELGEQSLQVVIVEAGDVKDVDIQIKLPCDGKTELDFPVPGGPYNK